MCPAGQEERRDGDRNWLWGVAAALAFALLIGLAWQRGLLDGIADHDRLVAWMRRDGPAGPLICIGIQFLQVAIAFIPGEITQIAAGYVFGPWWGFVYSVIGIFLGSAFGFGFSKVVGRPIVQRIIGAKRLSKIDRQLQSSKGLAAIFVLFLLPGAPKDALSYGAGLSALRLPVFLAISVPARAPALLLSTFFGSQAYDRNYTSMALIAAVAILFVGAGVYYQWGRRER